ncbi:MAG: hypothetical protein KBA30_01800 [Clostridia bacterium]|nr:hypothetical protein [Clostridia bacterium]
MHQYRFFARERCDEIQGFLFYKPMPPAQLEALLLERQEQLEQRVAVIP